MHPTPCTVDCQETARRIVERDCGVNGSSETFQFQLWARNLERLLLQPSTDCSCEVSTFYCPVLNPSSPSFHDISGNDTSCVLQAALCILGAYPYSADLVAIASQVAQDCGEPPSTEILTAPEVV